MTDKKSEEPSNPKTSRKKLQHTLKKDAYDVAVVNTAMTGRLLKRQANDSYVFEHQRFNLNREVW